jgi:hypothetical protein
MPQHRLSAEKHEIRTACAGIGFPEPLPLAGTGGPGLANSDGAPHDWHLSSVACRSLSGPRLVDAAQVPQYRA